MGEESLLLEYLRQEMGYRYISDLRYQKGHHLELESIVRKLPAQQFSQYSWRDAAEYITWKVLEKNTPAEECKRLIMEALCLFRQCEHEVHRSK